MAVLHLKVIVLLHDGAVRRDSAPKKRAAKAKVSKKGSSSAKARDRSDEMDAGRETVSVLYPRWSALPFFNGFASRITGNCVWLQSSVFMSCSECCWCHLCVCFTVFSPRYLG